MQCAAFCSAKPYGNFIPRSWYWQKSPSEIRQCNNRSGNWWKRAKSWSLWKVTRSSRNADSAMPLCRSCGCTEWMITTRSTSCRTRILDKVSQGSIDWLIDWLIGWLSLFSSTGRWFGRLINWLACFIGLVFAEFGLVLIDWLGRCVVFLPSLEI